MSYKTVLIWMISFFFIGCTTTSPRYKDVPPFIPSVEIERVTVTIRKSELERPTIDKTLRPPSYILLKKDVNCYVETDKEDVNTFRAYNKNSHLVWNKIVLERKTLYKVLGQFEKEVRLIEDHWKLDVEKREVTIQYLKMQRDLDKRYLQIVLVLLHNAKEDARYYKEVAKFEALISKATTMLFMLGFSFGSVY